MRQLVSTSADPKSPPPSRASNPFATCWTRPGALAYRFSDGQNAAQLVEKLAAQNWRGQITGPHGSGKSTLLAALMPALQNAGRTIHSIALCDGQRRLPADFVRQPLQHGNALIIIDGYEQLSFWSCLRLKRLCRRTAAGLLVTSHAPTGLPTLIELTPNVQLVEQLVDELSAQVSTPLTRADVVASCARHGSNVREIFFDLYDRHELLRRAHRTRDASAT